MHRPDFQEFFTVSNLNNKREYYLSQIVYKALEKLHQQTGLKGKWTLPHVDIDGELDLYLPNNHIRHFIVQVKKELRNHQLPKILDLATQHPNLMVVAEWIFPAIKHLLREKNSYSWSLYK